MKKFTLLAALWLAGLAGLYAQTLWVNQVSGISENVYGVHFTHPDTGFVCGGSLDKSVILKTSNGGATWLVTQNTNQQWLYDLTFVNSTTGLACGYNGLMLKTTDAGATWNERPSGTSRWLYDMDFINPDTGFVVGLDGYILRTRDGGDIWQRIAVNTNSNFYGLDVFNDSLGYAVGLTGAIFRTTDGGATWLEMENDDVFTLNSVAIVNKDTVIAVGASGTILRTIDGGTSWQKIPSGTTAALRKIQMVNNLLGYCVGSSIILRTTDGGNTWSPMNNPVTVALNGVFVTPQGIGYAVGGSGAILKNEFITSAPAEQPFSFSIYPNPAAQWLGIQLENNSTPAILSIVDLHGRIVLTETLLQPHQFIQISQLSNGIYTVAIQQNNRYTTQKFVKINE